MLRTALELLFPAQCAGCRSIGRALCDRCAPRSEPTERITQLLRVRALAEYDGAFRRAIRGLKDGRRDVAEELGSRLARFVPHDATFVPVPTTAARRRVRGLDGVELIAQVAAERTNGTVLSALRCIGRDPQRGRTRAERLVARDRFVTASAIVDGMTLVLVDDVCTTGTTLDDCARVLRAAGAHVTQAFVVAVANGRA